MCYFPILDLRNQQKTQELENKLKCLTQQFSIAIPNSFHAVKAIE